MRLSADQAFRHIGREIPHTYAKGVSLAFFLCFARKLTSRNQAFLRAISLPFRDGMICTLSRECPSSYLSKNCLRAAPESICYIASFTAPKNSLIKTAATAGTMAFPYPRSLITRASCFSASGFDALIMPLCTIPLGNPSAIPRTWGSTGRNLPSRQPSQSAPDQRP